MAVTTIPSPPVSSATAASATRSRHNATTEPRWIRVLLMSAALAFMTLFLFVPLATVFFEAFKKGVDVYLAAITEPDALSAIKLTLIATLISVPLNLVFGLAAAWSISRVSK